MLQAKRHSRYRWLRLRASSESLTTTSPRKAIDLIGRLPTDPPARAWTAEVSPHTPCKPTSSYPTGIKWAHADPDCLFPQTIRA
ncbi:uncharacterized protein TRAVEDRAFT_42802 [Trametes versicolor FP-101664 SS1]|uniref:uncharacterized protein n=1 Tax=Trametes versicolor (strain FP-101664) TaxID=717944 RepID=UPI00046231BC|nr:uncharacterized protein TRAVEDRAFT_42802 [Trametes versicolor FP-101664 SS1]EIW62435.1 hypothetical protein TRAVEDRAFT_42802 [Trametes versicolor FP-101664 SS1]